MRVADFYSILGERKTFSRRIKKQKNYQLEQELLKNRFSNLITLKLVGALQEPYSTSEWNFGVIEKPNFWLKPYKISEFDNPKPKHYLQLKKSNRNRWVDLFKQTAISYLINVLQIKKRYNFHLVESETDTQN